MNKAQFKKKLSGEDGIYKKGVNLKARDSRKTE